MDIGMLGVPWNSSGLPGGVAAAPRALREARLVETIGEIADVADHGDLDLPEPVARRDPRTRLIDPEGLAAMVASVRAAVTRIRAAGRFPLVIGGDCPILLGCLAALEEGPRGLLFVDGHEDGYPPDRSSTGEAADSELAIALGMVETSWAPELAALLPLVDEAGVRVLGARNAGVLTAEGVRSLAGRVPLVDDARLAADPDGETTAALSTLPARWWLHVDLDVLSTAALPAVDYPQAGGLPWDALESVTDTALRAGPSGWDVTIYNPDLDPDRTHAERIVRFLGTSIAATDGGTR